ncbi:hypothetical protein F383_29851 [Gossypium arboreum]|nr:hypothetical protein F383_29851 [Gossypium arboreum]
MSSLCAL